MNTYQFVVTPRHEGIPRDRGSELDVLVRLQAPDTPADGTTQRRHALNVACVIDRSGSMSGQPLEEAKRCVVRMMERLTAQDRAACVIYDDRVRVLVPTARVQGPSRFRAALAPVRSGGTTNLHGGWLEGAQQLTHSLRENEISRVILLSDGQANAGLTDVAAIAAQCQELATAGVTTSTYGLGRDFNEDLMIAMARKGGGNNYYGETAADLMEPFQEEFDLLQDLCARHVRLRISPSPGVRARVLNDYEPAARETWRLPDLAYGSEAWALVRLEVTEDALAIPLTPAQIHLMDLQFELVDMETRERRFVGGPLSVPALPDDRLDQLAQDEVVASRAREVDSAALQMRIRDAVRAGDWDTAERLLARAEQDAADHPWLRWMTRTVRYHLQQRDGGQILKETAYSSTRLQRRLLAREDAADHVAFDPGEEDRKRRYLRRKTRQGRQDDSSNPDREG